MPIFTEHQQEVAESLRDSASRSDWTDWKWHIRHAIKTVDDFEHVLGVTFPERKKRIFEQTVRKFPLSVTPYYLSLIDVDDYENDPIFLQSFPSPEELKIDRHDMTDPLHEDEDSPVPGITHRYPDRVLFHISNTCSMYCRHCTRKRKVGDAEATPSGHDIEQIGRAHV